LLDDPKGTNAKLNEFWYANGDKDPVFPRAKETSDLLTKQGIRHNFRIYVGGLHTWPIWRRCLSEFAPLLFQGNKTGAQLSKIPSDDITVAEKKRK
jgi:enterochelin esterase family protein